MDDSTFPEHTFVVHAKVSPVKKGMQIIILRIEKKQPDEKSGIPKHFETSVTPWETLKKPIPKNSSYNKNNKPYSDFF
jgi:hypothetical protein